MRPKKQVFPITREMKYVDVMSAMSKSRGIIVTDFMRLLGHTQTETASRLMKGLSEPRASQLATICTKFNFNMLNFFEYNGFRFETDIEDLYRMERLGIRVSDILLEHGVKPIDRSKDAVKSEEESERYMRNVEKMIASSVTVSTDAANQRYKELETQIEELKGKLNAANAEIGRIKEENNRLFATNSNQQTLLLDQQETIKFLRELKVESLRSKEEKVASGHLHNYRYVADDSDLSQSQEELG